MSIVRMKKLSLLAARSQKDELLRELMLLGCVELREQDELLEAPEAVGRLTKDMGDSVDWKAKKAVLDSGIELLGHYAPKKTPMLAPKPEVKQSVFLDESELSKAVDTAKEIIALDEKIKACNAEEARLKLSAEALSPWRAFDLPLETNGTRRVAMVLGTVPASVDVGQLSADLTASVEESQIFQIGEDKTQHYLSVFYLRGCDDAAMQVLRNNGFSVPSFGTVTGTAADNLKAIEEAIEKLDQDRAVCQAQAQSHGKDRELLQLCSDRANVRIERAEAADKLLKTDSVIVLQGWAAAPDEEKLKTLLEKYDCAYELSDPVEEEYPQVPVELKNNKLTDGLNMVTNMYSLPQYGTVDPNPLMAPFFILFYGIMMADMGYGLIMMIIGALILLKKRPKEGFMKYFGELMVEGGIATFVMGIFTGGFLGDAPKHIVSLINPGSTWTGIPALIDPLNDTVAVLVGAMILGFIHLNAGMVVSFVMKVRSGHTADAIWEEGSMWVLFAGIACAVLNVGSVGGVPVVLIIGLLVFAWGKMRPAKGIGKITAVFAGIYNEVTGWFGDILSYARLMALMLAGSVIAQVFNTLGAMPGNIIVFIVICLLGNTLNFGLNLLGCYVHDLRLQCLEFFNKFYVSGGKPFAPLKVRSKYYDVVK